MAIAAAVQVAQPAQPAVCERRD
eukprot:COSAG06_NODE_23055_length_704_cov_0.722314_2_plen_22_part_01